MCSLRPGITGLSERIRVVSVVDRYLEHARIFYFQNGGEPLYLLASADWMQRNFDRRVEIAFPVIEPALQHHLKDILETQLADSIKAWQMRSDGRYTRAAHSDQPPLRSQELLHELISRWPYENARIDTA
jgi:polyphosphate kinase